MSIRKPEPKVAVAMLRTAFNDAGAQVQTKVAYDLLARLEGYKNWAHFQAENRNKPADERASEPRFGHTEDEVADWPRWVFYTGYDEGEEEFVVMPQGTSIEDVYGNYGPQDAGTVVGDLGIENAAQRQRSFVIREVVSWFPRASRYGYPPQANDREVAQWIEDELGWGYLATSQGESLVETTPVDTGDDTVGTYAIEAYVSPQVHERLLAHFEGETSAGRFLEEGDEPAYRAGPFEVSLAVLDDEQEFLWCDLRVRLGGAGEGEISASSSVSVRADPRERAELVRKVATFLNEHVPDVGKVNLRGLEDAFMFLVQGGLDTPEGRENALKYLQMSLSD